MSGRTAVVVGGSIGGLFAALLLRRRGWRVVVCERVRGALAGRGAGIVTHRELRDVLSVLGISAALGVEVGRRVLLGRGGETLMTMQCPQIMTSWDRLFGLLRAALPDDCYFSGCELAGFEQDAGGVVARFADGRVMAADVLVGADGVRSAVRRIVLGDLQPTYAGYAAWRGLLEDIPAEIGEDFAFCLAPGEQMLGYPVAGARGRRYNFVWYRPADEAVGLVRLLTDAHGVVHAGAIPPPLIAPEVIAEMRAASRALLAPQFAAVVAATRQPFLQPVYDLAVPRMAFGRVALLGDAAFVVRPHVAAGVTKAAEDAVALAEALEAGDVGFGLALYERQRLPFGQRVVQRARHLGAFLQAEVRSDEERSAAARHQTAAAVLAETAVLDW